MFGSIFRSCAKNGPSLLFNTANYNVFKRTKMDFAGKRVIVTGGITGIGSELIKVLVSKKVCHLAVLDRNDDVTELKKLAESCPNVKITYCKTDVSNQDEFKENIKNIVENKFDGCLDIMVNNAGVIMENEPKTSVNINVLGVIDGSLTAMYYMDKSNGGNGGQIVNVASVLGFEPCPPIPVYTATKHAVIGWTRSISDPFFFEKTCVSHIAVCPGVTESPLIKDLEGRVIFPYALDLAVEFLKSKQTSKECACHIAKAMEQNINGSIWMIDRGKMTRITPTKYWDNK